MKQPEMSYELYDRARAAVGSDEPLELTAEEWATTFHSIALERTLKRQQALDDQELYDEMLKMRAAQDPGRAELGKLLASAITPEPDYRCPACGAPIYEYKGPTTFYHAAKPAFL